MTKTESLIQFNIRAFLTVVLAFFAFFLTIPFITYVFFAKDLQSEEGIMNKKNTGVVLLDRNDKPFYTFYEGSLREHVPLSDISPFAKQAVVTAEDKNFYLHPGISFTSMLAALLADIKHQSLAYGGSTITQQLVKNSLLTPDKDFLRKYQEIILAYELERRYSKDKILEMYLNSVYFGEGAFGIEDASLTYFGKSSRDLTLSEATLLASLLPAPSMLSPISGDGDSARRRQEKILISMIELGFITNEQKELALLENLSYTTISENLNTRAIHFALMVKNSLIEQFGEEQVARSGYKVKTTLDLDKQEFAELTVQKHVEQLKKNTVTNGAVVVENPKTGEILALVGSKNWYEDKYGKVNVATSLRSPGSAFKPIVYAAALENKTITPASILEDSPITYKPGDSEVDQPYTPLDYDRRFRGKVLVRRALVNSLNIPTVEVLHKIGLNRVINFARKLGFSTLKDPTNYGLSFALGAAEVKLVELTHAYSAFANRGELPDQALILSITDKYGREIYKFEPKYFPVLDSGVAFQVSSILSDNITRAEVFGSALNISRQAAVKTGTAEDYRDALTIGYTPSLLVGVWVGNNDGTPMDRIAGSLGAAPIWKDLMEQFLKNTPIEKFEPPGEVKALSICKSNGLLLRDKSATSSAVEYFLAGTEPTKYCYVPKPSPSADSPTPILTPTPAPTGG